jgi:hypothetical protein
MFDVEIFSKTARGRAEVSDRTLGLTPRLRSALILVDGKTPLGQLSTALAMLGDPKEILRQLRKLGLVESDYDLPPMPEFPQMMSMDEPTTMMEL